QYFQSKHISLSNGLFLPHFLCTFVLTQSEKCGLAQVAVARPFSETDFADQFRLQPCATLHLRRSQSAPTFPALLRYIPERTMWPNQLLEPLMKRFKKLLVKTGSHFGSEHQLFVLVIPRQQGPEILARAARLRKAADDELLLRGPFEFYPLAAAPADFVLRI